MSDRAAMKPALRRIPFRVMATDAMEVRVTGDFTRWSREGIPLSHDGAGGWRTILSLDPGDYQYRLLVDGEWANPADATDRVANPFGSENCVLRVV